MKTPCTLKKSEGEKKQESCFLRTPGGKFAVFNGPQIGPWIGENTAGKNIIRCLKSPHQ